jgi:hypothetical protein
VIGYAEKAPPHGNGGEPHPTKPGVPGGGDNPQEDDQN